jgi:endonuclease/exonuclease/phosphatase family metal-dependent hydrolase
MENLIKFIVVGLLFVSCSRNMNQSEGNQLVRVMSYNIHHCNPPSRPGFIDIDAIANVIREQAPDLVALQEVDMNTGRSGNKYQATEIAQRLNMHYFFGRAIDHDGGEYGVAILSKHPLDEGTVHPLPSDADPTAEARVLTTARIRLPNGEYIRFGTTHLDNSNPGNRESQVRKINDIANKERLPFIVGGDFNATPESDQMKLLKDVFVFTCEACEPTIPVINPKRAIDFIVFSRTSPFRLVSLQVIREEYASDHLPVLAELELKH